MKKKILDRREFQFLQQTKTDEKPSYVIFEIATPQQGTMIMVNI